MRKFYKEMSAELDDLHRALIRGRYSDAKKIYSDFRYGYEEFVNDLFDKNLAEEVPLRVVIKLCGVFHDMGVSSKKNEYSGKTLSAVDDQAYSKFIQNWGELKKYYEEEFKQQKKSSPNFSRYLDESFVSNASHLDSSIATQNTEYLQHYDRVNESIKEMGLCRPRDAYDSAFTERERGERAAWVDKEFSINSIRRGTPYGNGGRVFYGREVAGAAEFLQNKRDSSFTGTFPKQNPHAASLRNSRASIPWR